MKIDMSLIHEGISADEIKEVMNFLQCYRWMLAAAALPLESSHDMKKVNQRIDRLHDKLGILHAMLENPR